MFLKFSELDYIEVINTDLICSATIKKDKIVIYMTDCYSREINRNCSLGEQLYKILTGEEIEVKEDAKS